MEGITRSMLEESIPVISKCAHLYFCISLSVVAAGKKNVYKQTQDATLWYSGCTFVVI